MTYPQDHWAVIEAVKRLNETGNTQAWYGPVHYHWTAVQALAHCIATHEKPPVDPVRIRARELAAAVVEELKKRGLDV